MQRNILSPNTALVFLKIARSRFFLLEQAGLVTSPTIENMIAMTGFRNIAIHEYQRLDTAVLRSIATETYQSFVDFCREIGVRVEA